MVVNNFLRALALFETSTSKSGSNRPIKELDDFNSSMLLAESMSLMHTIASAGKLVPEQTSLLKFTMHITSVFEFGHFSTSIFLLPDTTVMTTLNLPAGVTDGTSPVAGNLCIV